MAVKRIRNGRLDKFFRPCYSFFMKRLNVGIFAHIDAGKTTLTERLLYEAGVLRALGSVDDGTGFTDFLEVERRRGISVRDATVTFSYRDTEINLIDTPGHADFFGETELALSAVDVAVLAIAAREGIEAQTELLLEAIARRNLPLVVFVNKCDLGVSRETLLPPLKKAVPCELLEWDAPDFTENAVFALGDEALLDEYLSDALTESTLTKSLRAACSAGKIAPVLFGSAKTGEGVRALLDALCDLFEFSAPAAPFSAFVYQVEHRKNLGKAAHVRVFSGKLSVRDDCFDRRTQSSFKVAQIKRIKGEKYVDVTELSAGETGAVFGLDGAAAGDLLGEAPAAAPILRFTPYLRVKVTPPDGKLQELKSALEELSDEFPMLSLEWRKEKRELTVAVSGKVQAEILQETLMTRFGIDAALGEPSVIYRETPAKAAYGFEAYTMPKPCWAVVKFFIEPLPRGSGFLYESVASEKRIAYRYQEHVKTAVRQTLEQGLKGWQVTDLKVTLVDGEHHVQHTHPLDFFTATPMGVMDGLRNCGTILLEPVLEVRICAPEKALGKVTGELASRRAKLREPSFEGGKFTLSAQIPAEETFDLQETVSSLTGGRGAYSAQLLGYFPCPEGHGKARERAGVDPLDRSLWILHCRGAYQ